MKRIMLIFLSLVAISVLLVSCGTGQAYARYGCGNGVKEAKEECDDGNGIDTDSCSNTCVVQQPDVEVQCKEDADCGLGKCVSGQCIKTYCGDGQVQAPNSYGQTEQCDDGNTVDIDSCSNSCIAQQPDLVVSSAEFSLVLNQPTG